MLPRMKQLPDAVWDALCIAASMVPIGAAAGLAALLRSKQEATPRAIAAALVNSGLLAGALCLIMFHFDPDAILWNIGISVLSGLGGNTAIGIVIQLWKNYVKALVKSNDD